MKFIYIFTLFMALGLDLEIFIKRKFTLDKSTDHFKVTSGPKVGRPSVLQVGILIY